MNNLFTRFESAVSSSGTRTAIEFRPGYRTLRWSYAELGRAVDCLARALADAGVGPDDRVLLYAHSSPHWVAGFFAILGRAAVAVPLNPRSTAAQLDAIATSAEPVLVLDSARLPWTASRPPRLTLEEASCGTSGGDPLPGRERLPQELAEIVYTSGTTGDPKGVMLSHANLLANVEMVREAVPIPTTAHVLTIVPLFHMYAQLTSMLYPLLHGCTVTYLATPSSRVIRDSLTYVPATHLVAVPEFLATVMSRIDERMARIPRLLRPLVSRCVRRQVSRTLHTVVSGGAALDVEVERKWRTLGFEVLQGYGLTETSPVVASNSEGKQRPGTVGRPCRGVQVRIAADGEIQVRGANVMRGYFRDEARTREAFDDGWFRTGDLGRLDDDGFLHVHGRKRYVIVGPAGENVFPEDVEAELNRTAAVRDSAVFGLERDGRVVVHAVLLCDGCDGDAVVLEANLRLAPHQRIMGWSLWPEPDFPRSATRKPRKEEIIAWVRGVQRPRPAPAAATPLARLVARVTGHDPTIVTADTRIVGDLGLDSLLRIELVSRIEDELNVAVDETLITTATTLSDLQAQLAAGQRTGPSPTRYPRWSQSPWATAVRPWIRGLLFTSWITALCRPRVDGTQALDGVRMPVMFMANHCSFLDAPLAIAAIPEVFRRRLAVAASVDPLYRKFRWFAPLADLVFNSYPLPTAASENIRSGLEFTGRLLDDGWNVLIFPEGEINRTAAALQPLKRGAGMLAVEMQVPVVPMAITGSARVLPPDRLVPRSAGGVRVRFGQPLHVGEGDDMSDAAARIEAALLAMLGGDPARRG